MIRFHPIKDFVRRCPRSNPFRYLQSAEEFNLLFAVVLST